MVSSQLEQRELSQNQFPKTWSILKEGLVQGVAPGFVAGFWQKSQSSVIQTVAFGKSRLVPTELPMTVDTVFDLASVSKVFATGALAAVLVDRGWFHWDLSVQNFFPSYRFPEIRVRHLLSHTAGFVAWLPFWEKLPIDEKSVEIRQKLARDLILAVEPEVGVEVRALYSDISFLLLGLILEEVTQMTLDLAVSRFVWKPLGIEGASFRRLDSLSRNSPDLTVAATEDCPRRGLLQGQVHDDNCWSMGGYGGHSGAFAPIRDVLHFGKKLLEGFLTPSTLHAIWTRVSRPQGCERTLGWDTPSGESSSVGRYFSAQSVGHLGFTGTSIWIDPKAELVVSLLSNRVHPSRANTKIKSFRPRFHEAIRLDLGF